MSADLRVFEGRDEPGRRLLLGVFVALLFIGGGVGPLEAQGDGPPTSRPSPEAPDTPPSPVTYPESWTPLVESLRTGTVPEKGTAVDELLALENAEVIPLLVEALGDENSALRIRITSGILRTFPTQAPDLFFSLFEDPSVHRREAALYAVGSLDDVRTVPSLIRLIDSEHEALAEAATRSLLNRGKQGANSAYQRVTGKRDPHSAKYARLYRDTSGRVIEHLLATGRQGSMRSLLFQRFADASAAERARAAYVSASEENPAAEVIAALGTKLGSWTPRPSLPGTGSFLYSIKIENHYGKTDKTVPIEVNQDDFRALQYWSYFLDRVVRLELPIDILLLDPLACDPKLTIGEGTKTIRYRLPERTTFSVGVGILNIAYWSGVVRDGHEVELIIDSESGFPRSETVRTADGTVQMSVEYLDPIAVRNDSSAPSKIRVTMPSGLIGNQTLALRYEFDFRVTEGLWHFSSGKTYVRDPKGASDPAANPGAGEEQMRASATMEYAIWDAERAEPGEKAKGASGDAPAGEKSGKDKPTGTKNSD